MRLLATAFLLSATIASASEELVQEAKQKVSSNFKDPYSAVFEGVYMGNAANGDPVVCGTVNAKNSYGAFVGRRRFYYLPGTPYVDDGRNQDVVLHALCGK